MRSKCKLVNMDAAIGTVLSKLDDISPFKAEQRAAWRAFLDGKVTSHSFALASVMNVTHRAFVQSTSTFFFKTICSFQMLSKGCFPDEDVTYPMNM